MNLLGPIVVLKDEYTDEEYEYVKFMLKNVPEFIIMDERSDRNRLLVTTEQEAKRILREAGGARPTGAPAKIEIKEQNK